MGWHPTPHALESELVFPSTFTNNRIEIGLGRPSLPRNSKHEGKYLCLPNQNNRWEVLFVFYVVETVLLAPLADHVHNVDLVDSESGIICVAIGVKSVHTPSYTASHAWASKTHQREAKEQQNVAPDKSGSEQIHFLSPSSASQSQSARCIA